ncbi:type II toxin-antitoxin system VapC family toxin [Microbacterium sp.]|uniref:type II toxin-antitoxin system VapC family toxin n=1 Tax=Microbacterium sp. TaxID=51671 RepID=UPI003A94DA6A
MIVVDASVVVNSLLGVLEPETLSTIKQSQLGAPDILDVEVASALRGLWLGHKLNDAALHEAVEDLGEFAATRFTSTLLVPRAIRLRANLSVYDATYVALAEALECTLLTRDRRIAEAPGIQCAVEVI